jgi:hypothetical protein
MVSIQKDRVGVVSHIQASPFIADDDFHKLRKSSGFSSVRWHWYLPQWRKILCECWWDEGFGSDGTVQLREDDVVASQGLQEHVL